MLLNQETRPTNQGINHTAQEQAELVSLLLEMPYLVMARWIVTRGKATGEWVMPPLEAMPPQTAQGGMNVPGSSQSQPWEGRPNGRVSPPPVLLEWGEQAQPGDRGQFLKNSSLPSKNSASCPSFPALPSHQPPSATQPSHNMASSTITGTTNPARGRSMLASSKPNSTGYPYRYSPYFKAAEKLIETEATGVIGGDIVADCKLVLALIVAWCNYSLFKSEGSGRKGEWMTLSRVKMARELGKQDARIGECLAALARVGLINYGLAGEEDGIISQEEFEWVAYDCRYLAKQSGGSNPHWYWSVRSCQRKRTIFYRLLVQPGEVLPPFEPFGSMNGNHHATTGQAATSTGNDQISRASNDPGRNERPVQPELEELRKDAGSTQNDLNELGSTSTRVENYFQVIPRSFPDASLSACSYVLNDDEADEASTARLGEDQPEAIKAETRLSPQLSTVPTELGRPEPVKIAGPEPSKTSKLGEEIAALRSSPVHWAKFEYLTKEVRFPGFEKAGKETLDLSQCVWLSASNTVGLELLQERYGQVLELWEQGKCYSPLGLFYASMRDNYDPRSSGAGIQLKQLVNGASKRAEYQSRAGWGEGVASKGKEPATTTPIHLKPFSHSMRRTGKMTYPTRLPYTNFNQEAHYPKLIYQSYFFNKADCTGNSWPAFEEANPDQPEAEAENPLELEKGWERVCEALGTIFRRPDLQTLLLGAKLAVDNQTKIATISLLGGPVATRSLLSSDKALVQLAFSRQLARGYTLVFG